jgi:mRNA interferase MazF
VSIGLPRSCGRTWPVAHAVGGSESGPGAADPLRGRVYLAPLAEDSTDNKFWLCVSNNERNRVLKEFVAVRLTTTPRHLPTWVELTPADHFAGSVNCDDIGPIYRDQVIRDAVALSAVTMRRVDAALIKVMGIDITRLP